MSDGEREFQLHAWHSVGEFAFIDGFIKEATKLVVDFIHAVHHVVGDLAELGLSRANGFGGAGNRYGGMDLTEKRWAVKDECSGPIFCRPQPIFIGENVPVLRPKRSRSTPNHWSVESQRLDN